MLHFPAQESLDTLRYSIQRHQRLLPHAIAIAYLEGNSYTAEQYQQQIQAAKERLERFEPHLSLIADIEALLVELPNTPQHKFLQQQWRLAIDKIGNLSVPQSTIQTLALRCDLLSLGWSFTTETFHQMKYLRTRGHQSQLLKGCFQAFLAHWEQLWSNFFDLNNPSAEEEIRNLIQHFSRIQIQLMDVER